MLFSRGFCEKSLNINQCQFLPSDLFSNSETGAKLQSKDGMFQPLHDYDSVFTEDMSPHSFHPFLGGFLICHLGDPTKACE